MLGALGLAAVCTALAASMAAAREASIETNFPPKVAGFVRSGLTDSETRRPGFGWSASYRKGMISADVFAYTLGRSDIPAGYDGQATQDQLAQAGREIKAAVDEDVYRLAEAGRALVISSDDSPDRLDCDRYNIVTQNSEHFDTLVCVTTRDGKFLKFRLVGPEGRLNNASITPFLQAWLRRS